MFNLHGSRPFDDWALCELVKRSHLTIKVSKPSAIEHIGVLGMNNAAPKHFDHSIDFPRDYIDEATRDYFLKVQGFDLLRRLESGPDRSLGADALNRFAIPMPKNE